MTAAEGRALREQQLGEALRAVADAPGSTAYQVGLHVTAEPPVTEILVLAEPQTLAGQLGWVAPLTLTLGLLKDLMKAGKVRAEPDEHGARWYPAEHGGEPPWKM